MCEINSINYLTSNRREDETHSFRLGRYIVYDCCSVLSSCCLGLREVPGTLCVLSCLRVLCCLRYLAYLCVLDCLSVLAYFNSRHTSIKARATHSVCVGKVGQDTQATQDTQVRSQVTQAIKDTRVKKDTIRKRGSSEPPEVAIKCHRCS